MRHLVLLVFFVCAAGCPAPEATDDAGAGVPDQGFCPDAQIIRQVRVIDEAGPRDHRRVVICGARILSEEPDAGAVGPDEIDGTGKTLLPGLFDLHLHLPPAASFRDSQLPPQTALHVRALLASGVTTGLDLGTARQTIFALRARLNRGELLGPRLLAAGPLFTVPGGHPCIDRYDAASCAAVTDVASAQALVGALLPDRPDLIKLVIEGGGGPFRPLPRTTQQQAQAVVQAAARGDVRTIAHVSSPQDLDLALLAGVAALAHVPVTQALSDEQIRTLAQRRVPVVSTLVAYEAFGHYLDEPAYLDDPLVRATVSGSVLSELADPVRRAAFAANRDFVAAMRRYTEIGMDNIRRLHEAGVPILAGSDAGNFLVFHGPALHRELQLLVRAGLTPLAALRAATTAPAAFLGLTEEVGAVRAGLRADLLLVAGDPSRDISATTQIAAVWREGRRLPLADLDVRRPLRELVLLPAPQPLGQFCVDAADCQSGLGCDSFRGLCETACDLARTDQCPQGQACLSAGVAGQRGYCYPGDGCDPLRQDCPFSEVYKTSCFPLVPGYTFCWPSGAKKDGESCSWYASGELCQQGHYCGQGDRCYALCDPTGVALPMCQMGTHCADLRQSWGAAVGLCVP